MIKDLLDDQGGDFKEARCLARSRLPAGFARLMLQSTESRPYL